MKIVKVIWLDSCGAGSSWTSLEKIREQRLPATCISLGFLIYQDENIVIVGPHLCEENVDINVEAMVSGEMSIPRRSITSMEDLLPTKSDQLEFTSDLKGHEHHD